MDIESTRQPKEIITEIISKLHGKDLLNAVATCKTFKEAIDEEKLWKERCQVANIDMTLFNDLCYKTYEHMFVEQVKWRPYTFMIGERHHLKIALLGDTLFLYAIEYLPGDTKSIVSSIELSVADDILGYRHGLKAAVQKIHQSSLILEKWFEPGYKALKEIIDWEFLHTHSPEAELMVEAATDLACIQFVTMASMAIEEIVTFGEVRWLRGRCFKLTMGTGYHATAPLVHDLDAEPQFPIKLDLAIWKFTDNWSYYFLYYHHDERFDGYIPNGLLPLRYGEWVSESRKHYETVIKLKLYDFGRTYYRWNDRELLRRMLPDEDDSWTQEELDQLYDGTYCYADHNFMFTESENEQDDPEVDKEEDDIIKAWNTRSLTDSWSSDTEDSEIDEV